MLSGSEKPTNSNKRRHTENEQLLAKLKDIHKELAALRTASETINATTTQALKGIEETKREAKETLDEAKETLDETKALIQNAQAISYKYQNIVSDCQTKIDENNEKSNPKPKNKHICHIL